MPKLPEGLSIFAGITFTFSLGWVGLIALPHFQLSDLTAQAGDGSADVYPRPLEGQAAQGRAVYISEGCVYCHSQQVRGEGFGTDIARGWGDRRTLPRDSSSDSPPQTLAPICRPSQVSPPSSPGWAMVLKRQSIRPVTMS